VIPYFRCSDEDINKVYYFLWSIYLMYITQGDAGTLQQYPHTQTALNNFLGMHRYDAEFQILVGSWASPVAAFAQGNVLAWSKLLPFRSKESPWELPDNFGTTWASGVFGGSASEEGHVLGAWQVFEHSGDLAFLGQAYDFYKELFKESIPGHLISYDAVRCLRKMAVTLRRGADEVSHWNATALGLPSENATLTKGWQPKNGGSPFMYGSTKGGMTSANIRNAEQSTSFPDEWVRAMASHWMDDEKDGFSSGGDAPLLSTSARRDWKGLGWVPSGLTPDGKKAHNMHFAVTPDTNWAMLRALYMHHAEPYANKFALGHLKGYNTWPGPNGTRVPIAPEAHQLYFDADGEARFAPFGDQYSNFNAGKIQIVLEGLGGLAYSVTENSFTFADNLPAEWGFMEFAVPVVPPSRVGKAGVTGADVSWVTTRAERACKGGQTVKTVTVAGNPFGTLNVQPWGQGLSWSKITANGTPNAATGHVDWQFSGAKAEAATVVLEAGPGAPKCGGPDATAAVVSM